MLNHCMFLIEDKNIIVEIKKKINQPTDPHNWLSVTNTIKPIKDIVNPNIQNIKPTIEYLIFVFIVYLVKFWFIGEFIISHFRQ